MHLELDDADPRPLPVRIASAVRALITGHILAPGDPVPSTRELATQLGVSRGTVVTAYDQLLAEAYLVSIVGAGTRVNPELHVPAPAPARPTVAPTSSPAIALTPGLPDSAGLITPQWRAAWRSAASAPVTAIPPAGLPALRREVAAHLRHMRGLLVDPDHIIITAGARDGLVTLLRAAPHVRTIGVESPGYPGLRRVPAAMGRTLVDVPSGASGVAVPEADLDALIVTPSHQYPNGATLPAPRRAELVAWARESGALLIEDDFDSELRYAGQPQPALTSLAPDRTILLGTFTTLISPAVACGYVVAPPELMPDLVAVRELFGSTVAAMTQQALAEFLASGALRRHTGRVRRTYRRRRDLVLAALADAPGARVRPIDGGLHAVIECAHPAEVVAAAAARGVGITALADYWGGAGDPGGIVIGFGHLDDATLREALGVVRAALEDARPAS